MTEDGSFDRAHGLLRLGSATYIARQSGLYRIGSGGQPENLYANWRPGEDLPTLALAAPAKSGLLLAGIHGGVARSKDGGQSWQAQPFRLPPPLVTCLAPSPNFAADGCILAGSYADGIFRSSDGGQTWLPGNHGLFDHSVYCLALSPNFAADGLAFAGTSSGLYKSENGGRLWQDVAMPADAETVLSLALSLNFALDKTLYAGCEAHGLLRSCDGGENWTTLLANDGAVNALALTDTTLVALLDDTVLLSDDDGERWQTLIEEAVDCFILDGENILLALADGRLSQETIMRGQKDAI